MRLVAKQVEQANNTTHKKWGFSGRYRKTQKKIRNLIRNREKIAFRGHSQQVRNISVSKRNWKKFEEIKNEREQ